VDALEDVLPVRAGQGEDPLGPEDVGALGRQQFAEPVVESFDVDLTGEFDADRGDALVVLVVGVDEELWVGLEHPAEVERPDVEDQAEVDLRAGGRDDLGESVDTA
jgi:hypothetical protein